MAAWLEFGRQGDGSIVLAVVRHDASCARCASPPQDDGWLRREVARWAIERELRVQHGRFRLVAGGLEFDAFAVTNGPARRSVDEAHAVEPVIELLHTQRQTLTRWTSAEINGYLANAWARARLKPLRAIGENELRDLSRNVEALLASMVRLQPGQSMRLPIDW